MFITLSRFLRVLYRVANVPSFCLCISGSGTVVVSCLDRSHLAIEHRECVICIEMKEHSNISNKVKGVFINFKSSPTLRIKLCST